MKESHDQKINSIQRKEPLRLVALSDGLFATVLTLLVLDLRIPDALNVSSGNISIFLDWLGPHLFSYLLTFLVAGTYWMAHHRDFDRIQQYDRGLLGYNLLFLLFIGLLPFTTANLSLPNYQSISYAFFWGIYAANIILAGIMLTLIWIYAVSHKWVTPETTRRQIRYITIRQIVTPAVFLISIVAGFLFPKFIVGPIVLLLIPVSQRVVEYYYSDKEPKKTSAQLKRSDLIFRAGITVTWLLIIGLAIWAMVR